MKIYVIYDLPFLASPLPSPMRSPAVPPQPAAAPQHPCCSALYDFEPENPGIVLKYVIKEQTLQMMIFR